MTLSNPTATLISHRGASLISREALKGIHTPLATLTHTPIPHAKLLDTVEEILHKQSLEIIHEEYSVMGDGQRLFGVMKLQGIATTNSEYRMALGLRASNDKTIPVSLIAGANIFVCDNMAFSGDAVVLKRKHTSKIDIQREIESGIENTITRFNQFGKVVIRWKEQQVTTTEAKALILDAAVEKVMPLHLCENVLQEWTNPKHKEFEARTIWSLHNGFTESFKLLRNQHVQMESAEELARFLERKGV